MKFRNAVSVTVFTVAASQAFAGNVVDTFLPGTNYIHSTGWTVASASSLLGFDASHAQSFVAAETATATRLEIAMGYIFGGHDFKITFSDDNGGAEGNPLATYDFTATGQFGQNSYLSLPISGPTFTLGTKYWIRATAVDDAFLAWNFGTNGANGQAYGAFRVVPEPASLSVLGLGALALLRKRRRA